MSALVAAALAGAISGRLDWAKALTVVTAIVWVALADAMLLVVDRMVTK
jgi:type IV secretory pathway VirB2 component (pilin)